MAIVLMLATGPMTRARGRDTAGCLAKLAVVIGCLAKEVVVIGCLAMSGWPEREAIARGDLLAKPVGTLLRDTGAATAACLLCAAAVRLNLLRPNSTPP
jgi:hypothetical protein